MGQIGGHGDVYRHIIGEHIHIQLVRRGHGSDLPPLELGQGPFAPGELVDGQIDIKAQRVDFLHNALVARGEGVEGAGEEGHRPQGRVGEVAQIHLTLNQEPVQMVQRGGTGEEGQLIVPWLAQQRQQLLADLQEIGLAHRQGQTVLAQYILAEDRQGCLMNGVVIVGNARQQQADDTGHQRVAVPAGAGQLTEDDAQRQQRRPGGRDAGSPHKILQEGKTFLHFFHGQTAQQRAEIFGNIPGNLLLARFQFPQQIHDNFVPLVCGQQIGNLHQALTGLHADGQMLADRQQIGQVGGRVEGRGRVQPGVITQQVNVGDLDAPVDGVFEVGQIQLGHGHRQRQGAGMPHGRP